jgi:hypothetical protein
VDYDGHIQVTHELPEASCGVLVRVHPLVTGVDHHASEAVFAYRPLGLLEELWPTAGNRGREHDRLAGWS